MAFCPACEAKGTYIPAAGDDLCDVHRWRIEAAQLSPDYFDSWWRSQNGGKPVPRVLQPDFELKTCGGCGTTVLPWQLWQERRGTRRLRWCTPAEYHRKVACSAECGTRVGRGGQALGDGRYTGVGEMRRHHYKVGLVCRS